MRHGVGKDIGVEDDNHSYNCAQSNGMPNNEPKDLALVSYLIRRGCSDDDRLRIYHLPHYTTSAISCTHQDGIKIELLRRNALQASE